MRISTPAYVTLLALAASALGGCATVGPHSVVADRFDYSSAIGESWKEQTLLNIVKIRYMDTPVFVDVSSIVAGYSMQTGVSVNGVVSSSGAVQGNYGSAGGQAIFTEKPTITYVPLTGEKFLRGLITPIEPKNIFFLLQSGYAADFILALSVESMNGLRNRSVSGGIVREADPEFVRLLQLLRDMQLAGAVALRVEVNKEKDTTAFIVLKSDEVPVDVQQKGLEIRRLLRMPEDQQKFVLTYSPMRGAANELAVNSRSLLQILQAFASYVDVPEQDLREKRVAPAFDHATPGQEGIGRIRSGREKPDDTFVAVRYRQTWFWVDDHDWLAKRALTAVMYLFTMSEAGSPERLPLVTIPAQ